MAYTQKGSLHDVLLNEKFNLTWDFRFSLSTDVAKVTMTVLLLILNNVWIKLYSMSTYVCKLHLLPSLH